MSQDLTQEDQTILAAIDGLERGADPSAAAALGDETAEMLARLYTEVLGLIPAELPPATPPPAIKARLMQAVLGGPSAVAADLPPPSVPAPPARLPDPFPAIDAFPVQPAQPVSGASGARRQPPRPQSLPATRRPVGWPGALAAGLILVFAGLSGWLWLQQSDQRARLAAFESELGEERQKEALASQRAEQYRKEFSELRTRLTLVTAPAALVAPLRPVGTPALQPDARGALFVAPDHQHWHLSIEGLRPATDDRVYQLWFIPDQGPPISGGTFVAKPNERVESSSNAMPPGTKSAMVTLEAAPQASAPTGPEVLHAGEMIQIL